jgi:tRNA A-37 threonylcarbamoyl transferase component Bud32
MEKEKIIAQGAEAKIILSKNFIIKDRIKKGYRIPEVDIKIRTRRTKSEAKLLQKASEIINCPKPFFKPEVSSKIKMPFIKGKVLSKELDTFPLKEQKKICTRIGESIAKLHDKDIIHGDLTTSNIILEEELKIKPKKSNNFKELLKELKKLNLPTEEYALFGSGLLAIYGIRDSKDIDIIVKQKLWNDLEKKYPLENEKLIKIGNIEIYKNWLPWFSNVENLIDNSEIFNKIRFVKLDYVLSWKRALGREKDKKDVQLIEEYNHSKEGKIYFIDFGLGFISHRIEDKAVDLHLIKQALEAKHFKNWETLFDSIKDGYLFSKDSKKTLEQLEKVEKRGRYKH